MEILTALNSLTAEAVFAIVGSVVAITTGLFGYLIKIHGDNKKTQARETPRNVSAELQQVHTRVSEVKDRLVAVESETKLVKQQAATLQKHFDVHSERSEKHFDDLYEKVDKMTDILIKILSDDKM